MHFKVGSYVSWKDIEGYVRFISEDYISICVNIHNPDQFDCCIVCYSSDWNEITVHKTVSPIYPIQPCLRSSAG